MCDSLAGISRAIVEVVPTDVVPGTVNEGAEKIVVWTEGQILVGVGKFGCLAVVVGEEASVVVFDCGKAAVLEDAEGTGAQMLIGMLRDDNVTMDDDVAPEAATEPFWRDKFGDFIEASNPTLPSTAKRIKIIKMIKARLVIPSTRSCATLSLLATPFSVFAAGVPVASEHLQMP